MYRDGREESMSGTVAVYGASGYTGGLVAKALAARGYQVVLGGRAPEKLDRLAAEVGAMAMTSPAALDDPEALEALCAGADVVVNCAGPAFVSAHPLTRAAIATKTHYVDTCAEQVVLRELFETAGPKAAQAGIALLLSCAFDAGLTDLLISHATEGLGPVSDVSIYYAVTGWRPSWGTARSRFASMRRDWLSYEEGGLRNNRGWKGTEKFDFPEPIGRQRIMRYPTPDSITVPRHTQARNVRGYMATFSLSPKPLGPFLPFLATTSGRLLRTPLRPLVEATFRRVWRTFGSDKMDDRTAFVVAVNITSATGRRQAVLRGRHIYETTVPLLVEAVSTLTSAGAPRSGALAPAQALPARETLERLAQYGLEYEITTPPPAASRRLRVPAV
jgi:short subunit dehydrogenase-like uncharacterized protein